MTRTQLQNFPKLPAGLVLEAEAPQPGHYTIVSIRAAQLFDVRPSKLGKAMSRHVERFGAEYAAALPDGTKVVALEVAKGVTIVLIVVKLVTGDRVLAVVMPDEQAEGERAVGALRRSLQPRTGGGR